MPTFVRTKHDVGGENYAHRMIASCRPRTEK